MMSDIVEPLALQVLHSRDCYRTCHVYVPDVSERLAAIWVGAHFYSFFRVVADREKAITLVTKLFRKGESAVITYSPKAYFIWVLEEHARRDKPLPSI